MAWISGALRAVVLAIGISAIGTGAALACDNCERHDGYRDGYHDGYGHADGYRYRDGGPQDRDYREGWRDGDGLHDGYRDHDCRGDGCHRYADDCRDHCYRHDDCRDNCGRHYDGCHDGCGHRYGGCHDGCGVANYSCRSGFYDCRFEESYDDRRYRERYYDPHPAWSGGGAYGFYGQ